MTTGPVHPFHAQAHAQAGATVTVPPGRLAPGADLPFVWAAYGVSAVVLTLLWIQAVRALRRAGEGKKTRRKGGMR